MHTYLLQLPAAQDADGPRTADCFVRLALAPKKDLIKVLVLRASPRHNVATAQLGQSQCLYKHFYTVIHVFIRMLSPLHQDLS